LGALRTLRPGLTLNAGDALNALRTLRASRALGTRFALRPGISSAGAERESDANEKYRKSFHDKSPL